ncbi:glutathione S-transferase [Pseudomonadales bacterium]|nr:glutathione S-transferase [Pseudomonadales bacterium]MDB9868867.1 glutathione S-transferase [Pseudomonadales bacterium]MDC0013397.1 glutathione S-transferase [Pseudomonadales bacterium]MDC0175292.1 glutathione S-transferase [Pseudomonadales bacterium]MDC1307480.1 glutathione S-transferase [Pseudomonadales bacterium]
MLKLYGFTVSNYFNMVKMALLEKGIEFEFVDTKPTQEGDYLAKSPMGKVPCLETSEGFISETDVIFDYLEDLGQGQALMPASAYEKAKVRELIKQLELYIELPARTCFAEAFFGGTVSEETKDKARASLKKGVECIKRTGKFSPYIAGDTFTYADIMFMYSVSLAGACAKRVLGMDLLEDLPEAKALSELLASRASAQKIAADQKAG